jgi:hypothetical protein
MTETRLWKMLICRRTASGKKVVLLSVRNSTLGFDLRGWKSLMSGQKLKLAKTKYFNFFFSWKCKQVDEGEQVCSIRWRLSKMLGTEGFSLWGCEHNWGLGTSDQLEVIRASRESDCFYSCRRCSQESWDWQKRNIVFLELCLFKVQVDEVEGTNKTTFPKNVRSLSKVIRNVRHWRVLPLKV